MGDVSIINGQNVKDAAARAALAGKQDAISDLAAIRSNANAGASKTSCTDATVGGFGYTKNAGTVTSVTVKMNGASKGKITSSGTVDLGTVVTDDASVLEAGSSGTKPDDNDRFIIEGHSSGVPNGTFITRKMSTLASWIAGKVPGWLNACTAITEETGDELTVAAGSAAAMQTTAISKSGYTPIGIVGFWTAGTNPQHISFNNVHLDGSGIRYRCRNNGSNNATFNAHFNVLWLKS